MANSRDPLKYISYSRLKLYDTCPRCFYWQYVLGYKTLKDPIYFVFGKAVHTALAQFYSNERYRIHPMSTPTAPADPIEMFKDEMRKGYVNVSESNRKSLDQSVYIGIKLLDNFMKSKERMFVDPEGIEHEYFIDFQNPVTKEMAGVKFKGYIDLFSYDDWIVEHKTSVSEWKQERADKEFQASAYALAFYLLKGKMPRGIVYQIFVKQVTRPRVQTIITYRDMKDMVQFYEWGSDIISKVRQGIYPRNPVICKECGERDGALIN